MKDTPCGLPADEGLIRSDLLGRIVHLCRLIDDYNSGDELPVTTVRGLCAYPWPLTRYPSVDTLRRLHADTRRYYERVMEGDEAIDAA